MLKIGTGIVSIRTNRNREAGTRWVRATVICLLALACIEMYARTNASDDFNRANSGTLGANWTCTQNSMGIVSNTARPQTGSVYNFCYRSAESWNSDHASQAVYNDNGAAADMELTVRHQTNGDLYMLMVHSINGLRLYKYISGGFTLIVDFNTAAVSGHSYKLEVTGSTLKVYDNAVQVGSNQTDSALSGGAPGIGGAMTTAQWNDWVGEGVSGSGGSGTDDFNRANSGTLGANWTCTQNSMGIVSNTARPQTNSVYNFCYRNGGSWNSDHFSQAVYNDNSAAADMELTVRHQTNGDLYMLMVHSINGLRLYKYISGGFTFIADFNTAAISGHTYKLEVSGSTLKAYDNGVQIGSNLTDSALTGGAPGIGGATTTSQWDNWVGGANGGSTLEALPLLDWDEDAEYLGGFKAPSNTVNGETFYAGGHYADFNHQSEDTLFLISYGNEGGGGIQHFAEISIVAPSLSEDVTTWNRAEFVQGFYDPLEGNNTTFAHGKAGPFVVHDNGDGYKIYGSTYIWYDADNEHITHSKYKRGLTLDTSSFNGFATVNDGRLTEGWSSEYMAAIPSVWRTVLGGDLFAGGCCLSIVSRHSYGMNLMVLNSASIAASATLTPFELVGYPGDHTTLGPYDAGDGAHPATDLWGQATYIKDLVAIDGTRTVLFVGSHGYGPGQYGCGTANESWHGQENICPGPYCVAGGCEGKRWAYDLRRPGIGVHAYPYRYQAWAYDMLDLAKVKAGTINPSTGQPWRMWDVVPYDWWELDILVRGDTEVRELGVAYDPVTKKLYIVQQKAEPSGSFSHWPLIHVFQLNNIP